MTLNIPLSPENEAKLRAFAAACGTDPSRLVLDLVEEKLAMAKVDGDTPNGARAAAWDRFVQGMNEWTRDLRKDRRMDDDRDLIYNGRGE